ncbi:mitochondrial assembly of ribosomal large subunit protein 1 [Alligator mississippiensis]|uniref:Mitochondrial assembly of ribosomal large subunit protein 1 n=1 Tax=Alligator mississippiensis TaxID=8496 RepID=A0A151MQI5_ALLMI|nr:mitochondrial assembly of ribosomal large subunit protein 1 [Alligator mississippiensis]KYO26806.1 mitochondrial assembly of ribosomal large subunit protein 1 [Alligator mississippiensis]
MWARGRWLGRLLLPLAAARALKAPCRRLGPGSAGCGLQPGVAAGRALGSGEEKVACGAPGQTLSNFNIDFVVTLLRQENAKDICVIQVPPEFKYSDYFIIVSGTSTRHVQAMAQYLLKMYKHLKQDDDPYVQIEGKDTEDWMCIDFGSMVIHLMLPETRETYELEKLWTLRSYDDQLAQIVPESLPDDFIFGLESQQQ